MFGFFTRKKTKREIIINAEGLETRVAIIENGRLEEFEVEHPTEKSIVGDIYKGRVQNLEDDLQAAFVDIGFKKNAFIHYWDMVPDNESLDDFEKGNGSRRNSSRMGRHRVGDFVKKHYPPGSEIVVQVTKGPIGTKGPRVTADLSIPGRYLVMMPGSSLKGVSRKIEDGKERQRLKKLLAILPIPEEIGLIVRTAAVNSRKRSFVRDLRGLLTIWGSLKTGMRDLCAPVRLYQEPDISERVVRDWMTEDVDRVIVDAREKFERIREVASTVSRWARQRIQLYEGELPIFEYYEVENQLEQAIKRRVNLKSGGYIVLDETEALIAVDVNTGRHKGSGSQEETILQVNTEAVREVARQLRLRNIGGLVVIDLIDMKSRKHQNMVYKAMKEALSNDRARTNVLPISELGILEMTRQRADESLLSSTFSDCPYCRGSGKVKSELGMSVDIQRQLAAVMRRKKKGDAPRRLQVVVHPTVLERLKTEDEALLLDIEAKFDGQLMFKADAGKHVEYFSINNADTGETLYVTPDR